MVKLRGEKIATEGYVELCAWVQLFCFKAESDRGVCGHLLKQTALNLVTHKVKDFWDQMFLH